MLRRVRLLELRGRWLLRGLGRLGMAVVVLGGLRLMLNVELLLERLGQLLIALPLQERFPICPTRVAFLF